MIILETVWFHIVENKGEEDRLSVKCLTKRLDPIHFEVSLNSDQGILLLDLHRTLLAVQESSPAKLHNRQKMPDNI